MILDSPKRKKIISSLFWILFEAAFLNGACYFCISTDLNFNIQSPKLPDISVFIGASLIVTLIGKIPFLKIIRLAFSHMIQNDGPRHESTEMRRSIEPTILKFFRWFVPRTGRAELDLTIIDLRADAQEMVEEGRSHLIIHMVLAWHSIVNIGSFMWDGAICMLQRVYPAAFLLRKISNTLPTTPSPDEEL